MVVVGVGNRFDSYAGELLNVVDTGFVVLIPAVVGFVVLVIPREHERGDIKHDFAGVAEHGGNHARTLVKHFADIAGGDTGERKRLNLVNGFAGCATVGSEIDMTVHALA